VNTQLYPSAPLLPGNNPGASSIGSRIVSRIFSNVYEKKKPLDPAWDRGRPAGSLVAVPTKNGKLLKKDVAGGGGRSAYLEIGI